MTPPDSRGDAPRRREIRRSSRRSASRHEPPARGLSVNLRKYVKIFRASLVERMTYRGDFLLGTILRFLPMVTTILLWQAIYTGVGQGRQLAGVPLRRDDRLPAPDPHQPDVLEHAGPGRRHRPRHPRGDAQTLPDPAGGHDRLPALLPDGAQGRLYRRRRSSLTPCLFFVCRELLRRLSRRR